MAVYTHFGAMSAVVDEVATEGFRRLIAHVDAVGHSDDTIADLRRSAAAYRDNALENRHLFSVMFGAISLGGFHGQGPDPEVSIAAFDQIASRIERAMDAGALLPGDPREVAAQFWSALHGYVMLELSGTGANRRRPGAERVVADARAPPPGPGASSRLASSTQSSWERAQRCSHRWTPSCTSHCSTHASGDASDSVTAIALFRPVLDGRRARREMRTVTKRDPAAARLAAATDWRSALVQLLGEHHEDATRAADIGELVDVLVGRHAAQRARASASRHIGRFAGLRLMRLTRPVLG